MSVSVVGIPGRPVQTIDRKGRFSSDSNVHEFSVMTNSVKYKIKSRKHKTPKVK